MQEQIQDTVTFNVKAEKTIVNKTVKLVATVVCMVAGETTEEAMRGEIREIMKKLVDADWQFSNMNREADDSGFERVSLSASVRVAETENYNLDARAKLASRKGLTITNVEVDTSVPQAMIDEAESDLRIILIEKIKTENTKISVTYGGPGFRVHNVSFSPVSNHSLSNSSRMTASATKMAYGSGFGDTDDSLGNASKLTMQASVTLARIVS